MAWADNLVVIQFAFAQRAIVMGADIAYGIILPAYVKDRNWLVIDLEQDALTRRQLAFLYHLHEFIL